MLGIVAEARADDERTPSGAVDAAGMGPLDEQPVGHTPVPRHDRVAVARLRVQALEPASHIVRGERLCRQPPAVLVRVRPGHRACTR